MAVAGTEKRTLSKTANAMHVDNGVYVEFSRVEIPMSIRKAMFDEFEKTRPKEIDLTDDEIQEMVYEVRYPAGFG